MVNGAGTVIFVVVFQPIRELEFWSRLSDFLLSAKSRYIAICASSVLNLPREKKGKV